MARFTGWGGAALVTGASSGIGLELAKQLAERGMRLFIAARYSAELSVVAGELASRYGVDVVPIAVDLATPAGVEALVRELEHSAHHIDVLVNNAGFAIYGPFGNRGPARECEMIALNVTAPTALAAHLLPGMIERAHGLILNVASTAGFAPMPWISSYAASKAYVLSWTRSLDLELRGTGVRATVLCPGSTATNFHRAAGAADPGRRGFPPQQSPANVASECLRGIDRGKSVIVTGALNRLQVAVTRLLPSGVAARLAGGAMSERSASEPGRGADDASG